MSFFNKYRLAIKSDNNSMDLGDSGVKEKIEVEVQIREGKAGRLLGNPETCAKLKEAIVRSLEQNRGQWKANTVIYGQDFTDKNVKSFVQSMVVSHEFPSYPSRLELKDIQFFLYVAKSQGPEAQPLSGEEGDSNDVTASNHWILPSTDFVGLWENLIYEEGIKEHILNYVETSMIFASKNINANLICCNRIVLLHGPPGMGKTSLCRAVAQKISIKFNDKYEYIHLVEINSHSLFSKWFSESGKLVQQLFTQLREIVENPSSMVCILIDEIESVAFSRTSLSSNEPSDSVRAVNAVLTQLDQIRKYNNVIILATSNLTGNIDVAFLDRADIKQYIGPPTQRAVALIYQTIFQELIRVGLATADSDSGYLLNDLDRIHCHPEFLKLCTLSLGVSGRSLRKIPMLAHAYFIDHRNRRYRSGITLSDFISAMCLAMAKHTEDTKMVNKPVDA